MQAQTAKAFSHVGQKEEQNEEKQTCFTWQLALWGTLGSYRLFELTKVVGTFACGIWLLG